MGLRSPTGRGINTKAVVEPLERRALLSAVLGRPIFDYLAQYGAHASASPDPTGYTPSQTRAAYGLNSIAFGKVTGTGAGQTIAIVDAYDTPTIWHDLHAFDQQFGLADPPAFKRVAQDGSTNYPIQDPAANTGNDWEAETALDVEWAHAVAPSASILLVEAADASYTNLFVKAPDFARRQPGVSVVSMSFGVDESSFHGADLVYTTPANHAGVTFVAASGDTGAYSSNGGTAKVVSYPASSPNVLGVGGTTLTLANNAYSSETAWGYPDPQNPGAFEGTGGGISAIERQPSYQHGFVTQSSTYRTVPDVALVADPNTGVDVYDSFNGSSRNPWTVLGGTSLSAPMWAGLVAVINQGRVLNDLANLDGPTQTLPGVYKLPASDFHDITQGNNGGYLARSGYDLTTGRGTPIANLLVPALATMGLAPEAPTIGSLTATPSPVSQGSLLTLTANNVGAIGGSIASVSFYRESNNVAGLQSNDTLLGTDTDGTDGWSFTLSTAGLPLGAYTFYAVARTERNLGSATGLGAARVDVTVTPPVVVNYPVIRSLNIRPNFVTSSNQIVTLTAGGVGEVGGTIAKVNFYLEFNGIPGLQSDPNGGDFLDYSATRGNWVDNVQASVDFDPQSGTYTFYAVAIDTAGRQSAPIEGQVTYTGGIDGPPSIGRLTASATTVVPGQAVTLTASGLLDPIGNLSSVSFYRESNARPGLTVGFIGDTLVGTDASGADPASVIVRAPARPGTYTYYAQQTDDNGVSSAAGAGAAHVTLTVRAPAPPAHARSRPAARHPSHR